MTNAAGELTEYQRRQLLGCYGTLHELASTCEAPGVRAAVRAAVAEIHAALDGQALEFALYSRHHRHDDHPGRSGE